MDAMSLPYLIRRMRREALLARRYSPTRERVIAALEVLAHDCGYADLAEMRTANLRLVASGAFTMRNSDAA